MDTAWVCHTYHCLGARGMQWGGVPNTWELRRDGESVKINFDMRNTTLKVYPRVVHFIKAHNISAEIPQTIQGTHKGLLPLRIFLLIGKQNITCTIFSLDFTWKFLSGTAMSLIEAHQAIDGYPNTEWTLKGCQRQHTFFRTFLLNNCPVEYLGETQCVEELSNYNIIITNRFYALGTLLYGSKNLENKYWSIRFYTIAT